MNELSLSGKKVLFVDDRYEITRIYMQKVKANGAIVDHQGQIETACTALLQGKYDFAVLDLHMQLPASLPEELKEFSSIFHMRSSASHDDKRKLNAGQILGMLINKRLKGQTRFIYLSAVGAHYEELEGGEPFGETKCFDKYRTSPIELVEIIVKHLNA